MSFLLSLLIHRGDFKSGGSPSGGGEGGGGSGAENGRACARKKIINNKNEKIMA